MALFQNSQINQILIQGAQLVNQALQQQTQMESQRVQMLASFQLREEKLEIERKKLKAQQEFDTLENQIKTAQLAQAKKNLEQEDRTAEVEVYKANQLKLSGDDPVEINRQYESIDELGKRRNAVQSQITDAKGSLISSSDPLFSQLDNELKGLDASLKWRIGEGAKRYQWSKDEAIVPIQSTLLKGKEAPAATAVQQAFIGPTQAAPTADLNLLYQDYKGTDANKKATAFSSLRGALSQVRGDSDATRAFVGRMLPAMPGATNEEKKKQLAALLDELQK